MQENFLQRFFMSATGKFLANANAANYSRVCSAVRQITDLNCFTVALSADANDSRSGYDADTATVNIVWFAEPGAFDAVVLPKVADRYLFSVRLRQIPP